MDIYGEVVKRTGLSRDTVKRRALMYLYSYGAESPPVVREKDIVRALVHQFGEKRYCGTRPRLVKPFVVIMNGDGSGRPLHSRLDLYNHSPTGFEWGYHGSGPAQLALALLADATGDDNLAVGMHQLFKEEVVANLDRNQWSLSWHEIDNWVESKRGQAKAESW